MTNFRRGPCFAASLLIAVGMTACTEATKTTTETQASVASPPVPAAADTARPAAALLPMPTSPADSAVAPVPPTARPAAIAAPDTTYVQDVAAYLAALPPSRNSPLRAFTTTPAYQSFARQQEKSWLKYRTTHTDRMTRWATRELDTIQQTSPTVFYPFSGPDFLNATTLFPTSTTYVLFGLEPVGSVPAQAVLENPQIYTSVNKSLWSVLNFSFFRTNDMAIDLKSVQLDGATPLLMLFAVRTGHQITGLRPVQLTAAGHLQPADTTRAATARLIPGVEIKLRAPDGHPKTLYYFSADISDGHLAVQAAPLAYAKSLGPLTTYVKSASYLMHKSYFSKIRNLVLAHSNYLLQDDSGVAMKYFPARTWLFNYYGSYHRPINLFAKHYQPELTAAYADTLHHPRPLPFGTGYNWRQTDSNLLLARRRQPVQ